MAFIFTLMCECLISTEEDRSGKERGLLVALASSPFLSPQARSPDHKPPRSRGSLVALTSGISIPDPGFQKFGRGSNKSRPQMAEELH